MRPPCRPSVVVHQAPAACEREHRYLRYSSPSPGQEISASAADDIQAFSSRARAVRRLSLSYKILRESCPRATSVPASPCKILEARGAGALTSNMHLPTSASI